MADAPPPPPALYLVCPVDEEETLHTVLKGTVGTKGEYTLDAVVECRECGTTRHVTVREPPEREVPIIVSRGDESHRSTILLEEGETVRVDDEFVVEGRDVIVTALETGEGRRPEAAEVEDIVTIWAKDFESVTLKFSINLNRKTIAKELETTPHDEVAVGDELTFGRLRVVVHAIKVQGRMLRRQGAAAEARDVVRVFARPTREGPGGDRGGSRGGSRGGGGGRGRGGPGARGGRR